MSHTPTPWVVNPPMTAKVTIPRSVHHLLYQEPISHLNEICVMKDGSFESDANAAFIVKACNAHDELVAAMTETLSWLSSYPGEGALKAYNQARAALAKVAEAK